MIISKIHSSHIVHLHVYLSSLLKFHFSADFLIHIPIGTSVYYSEPEIRTPHYSQDTIVCICARTRRCHCLQGQVHPVDLLPVSEHMCCCGGGGMLFKMSWRRCWISCHVCSVRNMRLWRLIQYQYTSIFELALHSLALWTHIVSIFCWSDIIKFQSCPSVTG